ncbi:DUF423 domain-containing protein [Litorivicinus lipolyticus]|uniref:DUF423 domain-containing protein n=1 Tax=Litorivicinus lipolyticus TaxID=418701 RepID=UPI003B59859B
MAATFCLLIALAIGLGAFGQHALAAHLAAKQMATFGTATDYLLVQSVAGLVALQWGLRRQSTLLLAGLVLFSGSLLIYLASGVVAVTFFAPVGGIIMIAAWLWSAWTLANTPGLLARR